MGFSFEQVRRLTYGEWRDYFEEYKKIFNMISKQAQFAEPRKVESFMSAL